MRIPIFFRLIKIALVIQKHGLDEILLALHLFRPLRFMRLFSPYYWLKNDDMPRGERIRLALEDLGPIFVKFGQIMSTRRDLLPEDIASSLVKLQDRVKPFPGDIAKNLIEQAFKQPIDVVFKHFEAQALASASVAQVHAALLHDGQDVVIKVLRPGVEKAIQHDIAVMNVLAQLGEKYWPGAKKFKPAAIVKEFERAIVDELDLMREASNASQLRRNFAGSTILHIPEIYWNYCHKNVMVMERVYGVPITDLDTLKERNVNMKTLAHRGVEIFFTQVFRDCFFHADMHPGNIFVDCRDPENPIYIAVDFGIIGTLDSEDQHYLAGNLLAFFQRDYHKVAALHIESGWVTSDTRLQEFEAAIRSVCEPIFEKPLKEISFGQMLLRLFQTARRFNLNVQPQLILLQKTLMNVEGLGRQLYPDLNLWTTAKPFLEKWVSDRVGVTALWQQIQQKAPYWLVKTSDVPDLIYNLLESQQKRSSLIQKEHADLTQLIATQTQLQQRSQKMLIGTILLVVAAASAYFSNDLLRYVQEASPISWIIAATGAYLLIKAT